MNGNVEKGYWMQLFANLLNACPIDTTNMQTHIVYYEGTDSYMIEVNAPFNERQALIEGMQKAGNIRYNKTKKRNNNTNNAPMPNAPKPSGQVGDYAYDVNYASRSPHKNWIEDQINLTANIIGARVTYLGGK